MIPTCFSISKSNISNPLNARLIVDGTIRVEDAAVTVVGVRTQAHVTSHK